MDFQKWGKGCKDLSILHGILRLFAPVAPRGLRFPVDFFSHSLADDQPGRCLGVILSGMGSDGTLGIRAIKERAGGVCVQTPATAQFSPMPRSALDAGIADVIGPAGELPGKILAFLQTPRPGWSMGPLAGKTRSAIDKICLLPRSQTGHDFSEYKRTAMYRRIARRMGRPKITRAADYLKVLQESPQEARLLFKELLIKDFALQIFALQNVSMDPPFTKIDILLCRNLLIYLTAGMQKNLLPLFHYCLNPGGMLFLGSAETIGTSTDLSTPLGDKTRNFKGSGPSWKKAWNGIPASTNSPPSAT